MNARRLLQKFRSNMSSIALEGASLTVILITLMFILGANIIRVIEKGEQNYSVYEYEKNLLTQAQLKNQDLKNRLSYVTTSEFQRLMSREVLGYVAPGEILYKSKNTYTFFDVEKKLLNVFKKKQYTDWWNMLIK